MDEIVQKFLRGTGPVLCVDIGSGTQDALLARPGLECENWPRFVLPAPARLVAQRIAMCRLNVACPGYSVAHIASNARRCRSEVVYGYPSACLTSSRPSMWPARPLTSPVMAVPGSVRSQ